MIISNDIQEKLDNNNDSNTKENIKEDFAKIIKQISKMDSLDQLILEVSKIIMNKEEDLK